MEGVAWKVNNEDIAESTRMTLEKINDRYPLSRLRRGTTVTFHDMTSVGYGWLLPGWVAEERRVQSGRIYRYYYDPRGYFYETQQKVLYTLAQYGIIVLDT